jgi:uncharacterized protein (DUF4415 family)
LSHIQMRMMLFASSLQERQQTMKKKVTLKKSGTDFERLDAMTDADIDLSDIPEVTPEMFAKGVVRHGLKPVTKRQLTLRLDSDVIEWFRAQGGGYQTRMNALLRAYMEEHKRASDRRHSRAG